MSEQDGDTVCQLLRLIRSHKVTTGMVAPDTIAGSLDLEVENMFWFNLFSLYLRDSESNNPIEPGKERTLVFVKKDWNLPTPQPLVFSNSPSTTPTTSNIELITPLDPATPAKSPLSGGAKKETSPKNKVSSKPMSSTPTPVTTPSHQNLNGTPGTIDSPDVYSFSIEDEDGEEIASFDHRDSDIIDVVVEEDEADQEAEFDVDSINIEQAKSLGDSGGTPQEPKAPQKPPDLIDEVIDEVLPKQTIKTLEKLLNLANPEKNPEPVPVFEPFVFAEIDSPEEPIPNSDDIDWEQTVGLNAILKHFTYQLIVSICEKSKGEQTPVAIFNRVKKRVFPKISRSNEYGEEEFSWPYVNFVIDEFDEAFSEMKCEPNQLIAVQLSACDIESNKTVVIFQGAVQFSSLLVKFNWKRGILGHLKPGKHEEILKLTGPKGKGECQMTVFATQPETSPTTGWMEKLSNWMPMNPMLTCQLRLISLPWESVISDFINKS